MPEIVIPDLSHSLCLEQFRKTLCDVVGLDQIANLVDTYIVLLVVPQIDNLPHAVIASEKADLKLFSLIGRT